MCLFSQIVMISFTIDLKKIKFSFFLIKKMLNSIFFLIILDIAKGNFVDCLVHFYFTGPKFFSS